MIKRRIAWSIIIIAAGIAYLFSNETVTLALLIACVAVPLFSAVLLACCGRKLKVSLDAPDKNGAGAFSLIFDNDSILPVFSLQAEAVCSNLRTGETAE